MAGIKPQLDEMSQVTNYTVSLQRYRQSADTVLANWPDMWAELSKAKSFRRPLLFLIPAILICNVLAYFLFFSMQRSQLRHSSDMLPSDEADCNKRFCT
ncbi:hypothetical protein HaLaN_08266 [Haematococcus lacustris]|uniref:Uncharacterized protein n=1 Tax=Haematococcus lacustris TaxID=44745 RepID=A0A699Z0L9_HAELA|nr:hypothetical protein HaLaN_08266 [Haematococcus lacustris]